MTQPTVAAAMVQGLMAFAVSRGATWHALAERAGIDPAAIQDRDSRIPFERYIAVMRAGQALCNDPALALHFGESVDSAELSIVGLIGQACDTLAGAFAQMNRYHRLVVDGEGFGGSQRFELVPSAQGHWFVDTRRDPNEFPEVTESGFARIVCSMRRLTDKPLVRAVHVTHAPPGHHAEYDRIFRVPVVFHSDRNAVLLDPSWAVQRIALMPRYMFGILTAHADGLLADLETSRTSRGRVEAVVLPILHTGEVSMEHVAHALGLSRQTLYRRLKAEGVTFEQVLDSLRRELALQYLGGQKVSVKEAAYLVGFSDPAAFSRAFKRWTGRSPVALKSIAGQAPQSSNASASGAERAGP
jgi:AraC-like DNA-binding protein